MLLAILFYHETEECANYPNNRCEEYECILIIKIIEEHMFHFILKDHSSKTPYATEFRSGKFHFILKDHSSKTSKHEVMRHKLLFMVIMKHFL